MLLIEQEFLFYSENEKVLLRLGLGGTGRVVNLNAFLPSVVVVGVASSQARNSFAETVFFLLPEAARRAR